MKKIIYLIILFFFSIYIYACAGYKPIFSSSNFQFKIINYSIEGDKKLGNQIYSNLYNLSKSNENNSNAKNINIIINLSKNKKATVKDSTGKIIEYAINLKINISINDPISDDVILNHNTTETSSYKVQDQYAKTLNLENKTLENLVNKTFQDLLIVMSEKIILK